MGVENGGTATVKDVFAAVGDLRTELGGKIDALSETVNQVAVSHEHRLTVVEASQIVHDARITVIETEVKKHSDEIAAVNDTLRTDEAAAKALTDAQDRRTSHRRWIIGTVIGAAGSISGLAYILVAVIH